MPDKKKQERAPPANKKRDRGSKTGSRTADEFWNGGMPRLRPINRKR